MDSPMFGRQKSYVNDNVCKGNEEQQDGADDVPCEWYMSKKGPTDHKSSETNEELKLTYAVLMVEKNIGVFCEKVGKCFKRLMMRDVIKIMQSRTLQGQATKSQIYGKEKITDPQQRLYAEICLNKVVDHFQRVCGIAKSANMKIIMKAWRKIRLASDANRFLERCESSGMMSESNNFTIGSKAESKKQYNSRKHAREMKENSVMNRTKSEYEMENEKLAQQILAEEYNLQRFTTKMNNLLRYHESRLGGESEREMRLSENGLSHSSFENNFKNVPSTKSQLYGKKK